MNIKDLFNPKIEIAFVENALSTIIGTRYGIVFNNKLFVPKRGGIDNIPNTKYYNLKYTIPKYEQLMNSIKYHSVMNQITKDSKFHFSKLKLNRAYEDSLDRYFYYFSSSYIEFIKSTSKKYFLFEDFAKDLLNFLYEHSNIISFSKFLTSNLCSIYNTGLAYSLIEVNEEISPDLINQYLNDSCFNKFHTLCLNNGFLVDSKMPWVIIYHITEGNYTPDFYLSVYENEMKFIIQNITRLWKEYVVEELTEEEQKLVKNELYLSLMYFQKLYLKIKLKEQFISLNNDQINSLLIFLNANIEKNGIENTIYKISNLQIHDNTIPKDWREVFY